MAANPGPWDRDLDEIADEIFDYQPIHASPGEDVEETQKLWRAIRKTFGIPEDNDYHPQDRQAMKDQFKRDFKQIIDDLMHEKGV